MSKYDKLCNDRVRGILYLIGKSSKPLSTTEVNKLMHDDTTYNYKTITTMLCPESEDLSNTTINPATRRYLKYELKTNTEKSLARITNNKKALLIELSELRRRHKLITNGSSNLAKRNYTIKEIGNRINTIQSYLEGIEKKLKSAEQRGRRYSLTFRGFLLYLYNELKSSRGDIRRIHAVISNPVIINDAPFLQYWKDFERFGFNVVDILLKISNELRNQLHIDAEEDNYLLGKAADRYFIEVTNYFHDFVDITSIFSMFSHLNPKNKRAKRIEEYRQIHEKITRYRRDMLGAQRTRIGDQLLGINFLYNKNSKELQAINRAKEHKKMIMKQNDKQLRLSDNPKGILVQNPDDPTSKIVVCSIHSDTALSSGSSFSIKGYCFRCRKNLLIVH